jgi:hypothetical protein
MCPHGTTWLPLTDFSETLQKGFLTTSILENSSLLKLGQTRGISTETHVNLLRLGAYFLGCENFQTNIVE